MGDIVLRSGRPWGRTEPVDIVVRGGRVAAVGPDAAATAGAGAEAVDLGGRLVLPGLVNTHCHLDKSLWGASWVPNTSGTTIAEMIRNGRSRRTELGIPDADRIGALLTRMTELGTTHVRTHTDIDPDIGLAGVEAVLEAAERLADRVTVEQVAFPQSGLLAEPATAGLMAAALRMGVGTVGGLDPAGIDGDPVSHLDVVFGLAERYGVPVDIHLHDGGALGAWQFELIAERTKALSLHGRVAVSHAFAVGEATGPLRQRLVGLLAEAGVALHTCAGFSDPVPPLAALRAAGVPVGLGTDGIRDLWNPYGTGDMLERAMILAHRSSFKEDADIELALDTATRGAARALGLPAHGPEVGAAADLVVVDGSTPAQAVVEHAPRFLVVKAGRVTAREGRAVG